MKIFMRFSACFLGAPDISIDFEKVARSALHSRAGRHPNHSGAGQMTGLAYTFLTTRAAVKPMLNRFVICVLSLLIALPSPSVLAAVADALSAEAHSNPMDLDARFERINELARNLLAEVNRSAFELDAVLDELEYDAGKVIGFVRNEISFEAYEGLLRGPKGTLMSRAGNSLDQAVLLAKLLRDAGFDARLAQGRLQGDALRSLYAQMSQPRPEAVPIGDVDAALQLLQNSGVIGQMDIRQRAQLARLIATRPDLVSMPEADAFSTWREFLSEQVSGHFPTPAGGGIPKEADYFWVEYKDAAADPWTAVHPAFRTGEPEPGPQKLHTITDEVPPGLQHRIRLQFFIEQRTGNELKTMPVSDAWERPAANLVDHPLTFASAPDSAMKAEGLAASPMEMVKAATFFAPVLNGSPAPGARYFDLSGITVDPSDASAAAAGVVKQVADAFSEATGALGGEENIPTLTANWIELTLIGPGGEEQRYRRMIFDRIGPAARAGGNLPVTAHPPEPESLLPFLQTHTLMTTVGRTPRGLAIHAALTQLLAVQPALETLINVVNGTQVSPGELSKASNIPAHWAGSLSLMARFDVIETWQDEGRVYRDEPMIVVHSSGPTAASTALDRLDIVHNSRRGYSWDDGELKPDPSLVTAAGIWETLVESSILQHAGTRLGTVRVFEEASKEGIQTRTILPGQDISGLALPPDARVHLERDLEQGYAVVIPQKPPSGLDRIGWWRVDPSSGVALGQMDDGRGVAVTEYIIVLTAIAGYLILKFQLYGCFSGHQGGTPGANEALLCCVLMNYAGFVAGAGLGHLLAKLYVEAIVAMIGLNIDVWVDLHAGVDGAICNLILN